MRRFLALLLLAASPAWAANYAACILDKAPGVANDTAANAVTLDRDGKPCSEITEFLGECKRQP